MTRLLAPTALLVLAAALVHAAPVPEPAGGPTLYFPTRVGATATYQTPDGELVVRVIAAEAQPGGTTVTVAKGRSAGTLVPHVKVEVSGRGLHHVASYAAHGGDDGQPREGRWVPCTTPLCLLKLPSTAGQKWDALDGPQGREACVAGRPEQVRVPAGEFTAIPVEVLPEKGRGEKAWYAAGVGPVKWVTTRGEEIVLKSFSPGKQ